MTTQATIEAEFLKVKATSGDIDQHLDYLRDLAAQCDHVVEGGVRYVVSTWAFVLGCACRGGQVVSYCWNMLPEIQRAVDVCKAAGVRWTFYEGDWLKLQIPKTDLLFIDTNHEFRQLTKELSLHGPRARRYIVLHDTERFRDIGSDDRCPGLWQAVKDLVAVGEWRIVNHRPNQNGLTTLRRIAADGDFQ